MRSHRVLRSLALALLGLVLAVSTASAASGPPLQHVAAKTMPDSPGGTAVTFAWRNGDPAVSAIPSSYQLMVAGPEGTLTGAVQYSTGSPDDFFESTVNLVDSHVYVAWVRMTYWQWIGNVPAPFTIDGPASVTTADFFGDSYPDITINGGARYTNRRTVSVRFDANDSTTTQAQYLLDGALWPQPSAFACSSFGNEESCPFALSGANARGFKYATRTVTLPDGQGLHTVWAQARDDAEHPNTFPPGGSFSTVVQGNASIFPNYASITVDTTAPVPALAKTTITGVAGSPVTLDATPSTDASAGIKTDGFVWKWGDGSPDTTGVGKLTHLYPGPGTYNGTVVVHDNAGNAQNPNDTNLASTTFKVTISPKPLATPTPTPKPTAVPSPTPTPAPLDLSGQQQPGGTGGAPIAKPDIPLTTPSPQSQLIGNAIAKLGGIAQAAAGPVSSAKLAKSKSTNANAGEVKAGKQFEMQVQMRAGAKVSAKIVDAQGKTVAKTASTEKKGKQELELKAPKKTGDYQVIVNAGQALKSKGQKISAEAAQKQQQMTVPITVAQQLSSAAASHGPSEQGSA